MALITATCVHCNKEYLTDSDLEKSFCLYCGAANTNVKSQKPPYDPLARKKFLENQQRDEPENNLAQDLDALWHVRYRPLNKAKTKYADTFLELWLLLVIGTKNRSRSGIRQTRKAVEKFFNKKELTLALEKTADPDAALYYELVHSARSYFNTCLNDRHYGSYMLDLIKLKEENIVLKIAKEAAAMMEYALWIDLPPYSEKMIKAVYQAYQSELPKYSSQIDEAIQNISADALAPIIKILNAKQQ